MTRTRAVLRTLQALNRPGHTIILVLTEVIGFLQRESLPSSIVQAGLTISITAWMLMSTALNDVADECIDAVNLVHDSRRVLVTGLATRRQLIGIAGVMACIAIGAATLGGWRSIAVMAVGIALSAAYSLRPLRLSDRGLVTSLVLPLAYIGVPFVLAAMSGPERITTPGWWTLAGLVTGFAGRLALKDFRDLDGDRLFGKRTLLVRHGRVKVTRFTAAFYAAGTVPLLVVTSANATAMTDTAVLSVLTITLVLRLAKNRADDALAISDVALLGRGQLVVLSIALAQVAHLLPAGAAACAATAVLLATLWSAWIDHSRRRYVAGPLLVCAVPSIAAETARRGAPGLQLVR